MNPTKTWTEFSRFKYLSFILSIFYIYTGFELMTFAERLSSTAAAVNKWVEVVWVIVSVCFWWRGICMCDFQK